MLKKHKYAEELSKLNCDCPPKEGYNCQDREAYRWVHADIDHHYNFMPALKITPSRIEGEKCKNICKGFGLSFFDDLQKAENKLSSFLERKPQLAKTFGTAIAKGSLEKGEGVSNLADDTGHFTFHEDENCDLKPKFTIIKSINI